MNFFLKMKNVDNKKRKKRDKNKKRKKTFLLYIYVRECFLRKGKPAAPPPTSQVLSAHTPPAFQCILNSYRNILS